MAKTRQTIYLMGDASLVEELSRVCISAGVTPVGNINRSSDKITFPKEFKNSRTIPHNIICAVELTNSDCQIKKKNILFLEKNISPGHLLLSSSVTTTISEQSTWMRHPRRAAGISAFQTLLSGTLIELTASIHAEQQTLDKAKSIFTLLRKEIAIVQDRVGMVMPRILSMLINEALFALIENIATPQDIDTAMKLGTNYPNGPIEWGNKIGFRNVILVLDALYSDLHEERYRVAPLLRQLATGKPWW
jgi:3-hydroxybutyryl-CoA dehydrogenase